MWADSHCHLEVSEAAGLIAEAREAGVGRLVVVGSDADSSRAALSIASEHGEVWATVGLHPHVASSGLDEDFLALFDDPRTSAIGECGLDYHYDHSPREVQRTVFAAQVELAVHRQLTLVVHSRDAWDDTFAILRDARPPRIVMHCFTGGPHEVERALELGAFVSFSGIVTFPNAQDVRDAAARCPADRLLVETDAPLLAPVPHRGKRNRPAWLPIVGAAVAVARREPSEQVESASWANLEAAFGREVDRRSARP